MRATLGEMNWLVGSSRPDLAASCSLLQQRVAKAQVKDLVEVNKMVAMARDHAATAIHVKPPCVDTLELGVWSDASWANAEGKKSQGGYLVTATRQSCDVAAGHPFHLCGGSATSRIVRWLR